MALQDRVPITSSLSPINSAVHRAPVTLGESSVPHQRVLCLDGVSAVPGFEQNGSASHSHSIWINSF